MGRAVNFYRSTAKTTTKLFRAEQICQIRRPLPESYRSNLFRSEQMFRVEQMFLTEQIFSVYNTLVYWYNMLRKLVNQ